jgi:hypothetical protein
VASTLAANADVDLVAGVRPVAWLLAILARGAIHKPVQVHLWPHMIVRPWYTMWQLISTKVSIHLTLHIVTMERMECDARPGMIWAAQAASRRLGRPGVHVAVDCTLSPLTRQAMRGAAAGRMFVAGRVHWWCKNGSSHRNQGWPII